MILVWLVIAAFFAVAVLIADAWTAETPADRERKRQAEERP